MGCVASRLEEEEEVVSICRERKQQLKLAVEKRYALADAHYRYCQSLFGVSAAINIFVARHSKPPSYDISLIPPSAPKEHVVSNNPLFLQQTPSQPTKEAITCETCSSSSVSSVSSDDEEEEQEGVGVEVKNEKQATPVCGYFNMDMPKGDFGWDFFNPFDSHVAVAGTGACNNRISEEDLRAVRDQEGIPELEDEDGVIIVEEGEKEPSNVEGTGLLDTVEGVNVNQGVAEQQQQPPHKGLTVIDTPVRGRELLEALKDIEDHFIRAYDSGKEVSRMLECNRVPLQSNLEEIKGGFFYFVFHLFGLLFKNQILPLL